MSAVHLLGYGVSSASLESCSHDMLAWILRGSHCKAASFFNPHSYAVAKSDQRFASALRASTWRQALIHNHGMGSVNDKLRRLMCDFRFTTLGDQLDRLLADGNALPRLTLRGDPMDPAARNIPQPQR